MASFFSSDSHFGHVFMAIYRGFLSADETDPAKIAAAVRRHDETIIRNILKRLRAGDHLYLLGDWAMGDRVAALGLVARLRAAGIIVHLILGNHDRAHPMNGNSVAHLRVLLDVFETVQVAGMIKHEGAKIMLSHFPYDGEGAMRAEHDDRASQWRLRDEGQILFHGHVHDDVRFRTSAKGTPMVHVGLDAWGLFPVVMHDAFALASAS